MEVWNKADNIARELAYAENRWNVGYRFGVAGASDNHFRELWATSGPGLPATRAFALQLSERAILQGLHAGRTLISARANGAPLATLEADLDGDGVYEAVPGDEVVAPSGTTGTLRIRVQFGGGTTVSLYKSPGKSAGALRTFMPLLPDETFTIPITAAATASWYYVEVRGPGEPDGLSGDATNPRPRDHFADLHRPIAGPSRSRQCHFPPMRESRMARSSLSARRGSSVGSRTSLSSARSSTSWPSNTTPAGRR
jgi:hypothetical protein